MVNADATRYGYAEGPIGTLLLAGNRDELSVLAFTDGPRARHPAAEWIHDDSAFKEVKRQLAAYFAGDLQTFSLPLAPKGTEFQKQVWRTLLDIPLGMVTTYGAIAQQIGRPKAGRAVGAANGANPISIIVPCHRLIGQTGTLIRYGGGLERKEFLLRHEGHEVHGLKLCV